jgi:hypothetical protein
MNGKFAFSLTAKQTYITFDSNETSPLVVLTSLVDQKPQ